MASDAVEDFEIPRVVPESAQTPTSKVTSPALFSLAGKTVAITGAGRGLGIEFAIAVLEAGGHVACLDILNEPAETQWTVVQKLVKQNSLSASYRRCDVTKEEEVSKIMEDIAEEAEANGAPFWGAVACAGIQQMVPALDYKVEDFERMLRVNVTGVFLTARHAAKQLSNRKRPGSIVLIASMSGQITNRGLECSAYNTSKAAVHQMCRSLAYEWGKYGIRVNTLSPGYIRTAMTDQLLAQEPQVEKLWMAGALLNRLGAPEDFKAPIVFLLAEGSSWMTGADLRVDGGHCASA